jgi:hypothetical protein
MMACLRALVARPLSLALPAGAVALALSACVEPDAPPYVEDDVAPIPGVAELAIDAGGEVTLAAGEGIGVAVEYAGDGQWLVTTGCDTTITGYGCDYDVLVSTDEDSAITGFSGVDLEPDDTLSAPDDFAVSGLLETQDDTDAFGFTTSPGATVRVSARLYDSGFDSWYEWSDDPRFISWVGDGAVHQGAPTNPVDLTPDRP